MMSMDLETARLERAKGNHLPLIMLFTRSAWRIQELAEKRLGAALLGKVDASDILQEVWIVVQRSFDDFRGVAVDQFDAWLLMIAKRQVDQARRRFLFTDKRRAGREIPMDQAGKIPGRDRSPSSLLGATEASARLMAALGTLSEADQGIILMHGRDKMKVPLIAACLGVTVDAAGKRLRRALAKLENAYHGRAA